MLAEQSLHAGQLCDALAQLQAQVRKEPANAKLRVFLFQLLAVMGEWERAMNQLNVAGELDAGTLAMVSTYRSALQCETLRARVFSGQGTPVLFGKPAEWMALLFDALRLAAEGEIVRSQQVRQRAFDAAPVTTGRIDGQAFQWIADADERLGPMLEAIINGRYYWIPFNHLAAVHIEAPADLRDVVWMPAHFTLANGGETVGLIPTRYQGSETCADDLLRLARKTDWHDAGAELFVGQGQRMLATDLAEHPLMDVREILLNPSDEA